MTKLFLIVLLVFKADFIACMGAGTDLFRALRWNSVDFTTLEESQKVEYARQIEHGGVRGKPSSLETAIMHGSVTGAKWLLSKSVRLYDTELRYALAAPTIEVEIVRSLLGHGADPSAIIDGGQNAHEYVRTKLANKKRFYAEHPDLIKDQKQLDAMEKTTKLLDEYC